ncbi:MAG: molecular chaperone [Thiohalomonadaceae bacterium]
MASWSKGWRYAIVTLAALMPFAAGAASIAINPISVRLDSERAITTLQVRNHGNEAVVMQVAVNDWRIEKNEERYTPTDALIVTPPIFTIPPGEEQVVRVGLREPTPATSERAFRVFLEQVPSGDTRKGGSHVRINLRFGIPVFVAPRGGAAPKVQWRARRLKDGRLQVTGSNQGNAHLRVSRLALLDANGKSLVETEGLTYLLAHTARDWTFPPPPPGRTSYRIKAWTQTGEIEAELKPGEP